MTTAVLQASCISLCLVSGATGRWKTHLDILDSFPVGSGQACLSAYQPYIFFLVCAKLVHYEEVFCHDSSEDNGHKLCKQQTTDASQRGHEWDYATRTPPNINTFFRGTGSWS